MKRFQLLAIFGVLALLVCSILPAGAKAATEGYYTYTVSNGEATITDCNTSISGAITIPSTLGGYPVTGIGDEAFRACWHITEITIPDGVTTIGKKAFSSCSDLIDITIPDSVTSISEYAFRYSGLIRIVIPDSVTDIGNGAFDNCDDLAEVSIGSGVTMIGDQAFSNCSSLTGIIIPDSVIRIGDKAFYDCSTLTNVTIGNSVTEIGDQAFYFCSALADVSVPDSIIRIGTDGFYGCRELVYSEYDNAKYLGNSNNPYVVLIKARSESITSCQIHKNTKVIYNSAFEHCRSLTGLTIPEGVVGIGRKAFFDCEIPNKLILPSLISIGEEAFHYCGSLTEVVLSDNVTSIPDYAFANCYELAGVTIGSKVSSIGERAFSSCDALTGITIPNSVTTIGKEAFYFCDNMTDITIGSGITSVADEVFYGCSSLVNVYISDMAAWCRISFAEATSNPLNYANNLYLNGEIVTDLLIPDNITGIGAYAFYSCGSLERVTIPSTITDIGYCAFANCTGLTQILVAEENPKYYNDEKGVLFNKNRTALITAPGAITGSYTIPSCVTMIENEAFHGCSKLTDITIPDGVTAIGEYTFYNCTGLTNATIGNNITGLGDYAFGYCSGLADIVIPDSVTDIGFGAFDCCSSLTNIHIPDSVTTIGHHAFSYCNSLTSVTIGNGVTSIGTGAFEDCSDLTSVNIPDGVTVIGDDTFYRCSSLARITIPDSVTGIGDYAFYQCAGLTSVTLGSNVKSIGSKAFSQCSSLLSVNIPLSVTTIKNEAFYQCRKMNHVAYGGTQEQWGNISIGRANTKFESAATTLHYEVQFTCEDTCQATGIYCPECQEYITRVEWTEENPNPQDRHVYSEATCIAPETCVYCGITQGGTLSHSFVNNICTGCGTLTQYEFALTESTVVNWRLDQDLYIDLNGFDLSGTIITNGFKVFGVDSTTDGYTCDNIGYFTCLDENGNFIVPERICTEDEKRYMTICTEDRYSFHRFFVGVTHMSLSPETAGLGYKAAIFGDEMVYGELAETKAFSFKLQLEGYNPVYRRFDSRELTYGEPIVLRIRNYDVENYSEHNLYAQVSLTLNDSTVIEAEAVSLTFHWLAEQVNANYTDYTSDQLASFKAMLQQFDVVKKWDISNLI